jgi:hypothetical protein
MIRPNPSFDGLKEILAVYCFVHFSVHGTLHDLQPLIAPMMAPIFHCRWLSRYHRPMSHQPLDVFE